MTITPRLTMAGAWQGVGILLVAWIIAFVDRQTIIVLIPAIKATLHTIDTQVSLLHGLAFALFFSVAGLAVGRLVDRANRRNLIVIGLVGWSLASIVCGLAHSFAALFAGRIAIGIFQAVLAPASFSIVADMFAAERRGKPVAALIAAASIGSAMSILVGGVVLATFAARTPIVLPLVGSLAPWQSTMIAAALPGLLLALVVAMLKEPERQSLAATGPQANFDFVGHLRANWVLFALMFIAFACNFLLGYGLSSWFPALLMRSVHLSPAVTGLSLGGLSLLAALIAGTAGGWVSDLYARRDPAGGRLRLVRLVLALEFLVLLPLFLPHNIVAVLLSFTLFSTTTIVGSSAVYAVLPDFVPNEGRGQIIAVEQLISALVGLGLGPTLVALVTDKVIGDESLVHLSMLAVGLTAAGLGAVTATLALPAARRLHAQLSAR